MSQASSQTLESTWPSSLIALLERQSIVVEQLAHLADSQAAMIAQSQTDRLLDLLARRQALIDEFVVSQTALAELTQGLDRRLQDVSSALRDRIRSLIGGIGDKLSHVMRRDEEDQASLGREREQTKHELNTLGTARQAATAYRAPGSFPSPHPARLGGAARFADHRG